MPLYQVPILVDGATHSAEQFRAMVQDLARGAEGITAGTDLKVTQLGTPGTGVQVASGSGVVRGKVNAFQGSYAVRNQGAATVSIASTGGSPRSDMLIARVEDPQYEGTLNPEVDNINYFQVISNVSSSATTIPDGRTGIPLARIDIPASTSTITNAMIKDIRQIANPRRERQQLTQSPTLQSVEITGSTNVYSAFNTLGGWNIAIPTWASTAKIRCDVWGLRLTTANFFGAMRGNFGASLVVQATTIDDNGGNNVRRITHGCADTLTLPDAYRGTTQLLRLQASGASGNSGRVSVDPSSTALYDVEFVEAPR
ncbi:hypothetical protein [Streptomyces rubiginosohelvolus]|uniref:Minor tail protein n=1 Tax=Streptomyces rubiginosohelvolus TaxID=67362 RepID=A0ABQ3CB45_9ACTN|nr:hypothetical protein [Streptomyces pluricolorescens]GGZ82222.1 hypothetical protein GCM10010328_65920 [Streptomyces pluricolorescens]